MVFLIAQQWLASRAIPLRLAGLKGIKMAHLMLAIGDYQCSVAQLPSPNLGELGDHIVRMSEVDVTKPPGQGDNTCSYICGEAEALTLVGCWLMLETPHETIEVRGALIEAFPEACIGENAWLLP